ncbi:hypothetical protein GT360_18075 [Vibrio astriarenae]|uniref:Uncharacterized protein n=1 Tax=Vibrio astriarenae TaxID=1481923 RepID=A0A7Z2YFG3_9VIBR|nr:heparin lyase I family protein [Vibrio astriarenae]QIA65448.1 hypothetical protein GT360_18075 [Vibrio astriarenae]
MRCKYLTLAILTSISIVGCNESDKVDVVDGNYDIENIYWDLGSESLASTSIATAVSYYFDSDGHQLSTFWQQGDEIYFKTSKYSISLDGNSKSKGTLTFSSGGDEINCKFHVADQETLDLTECSNSDLDITAYKATTEREQELSTVAGEVIWAANPEISSIVEDSFKRLDPGNYPQDYCWEVGDEEGVKASSASAIHDPQYGMVWKLNKPLMRKRAEFARAEGEVNNYSAKDGDDIYIGWRWKISTEDASEITDEVTVFQWKSAAPHDQNYPLNMEYDGTLTLNAFGPSYDGSGWPSQRRTVLWRQQIPQDEWVDFVVRIKVDRADFGGIVQFWYNGEQQVLENTQFKEYQVKLSDDGKIAFHRTGDGQFVYPKWGVYNRASCNYDASTYFGDMRIGKTLQSVMPR